MLPPPLVYQSNPAAMLPSIPPCFHPCAPGAFGVVEQCMYEGHKRMVAVKRLKTDVIERKADLEV